MYYVLYKCVWLTGIVCLLFQGIKISIGILETPKLIFISEIAKGMAALS